MYFSCYSYISKKILGNKPSCTVQSHQKVRGTAKVRYNSFAEVQEAYKLFNKRGKCPWEPYVCFDCWGWHLGTPTSVSRRSIDDPDKAEKGEQFGLDVIELGLRVARQLHNENNPELRYYVITGLRHAHEHRLQTMERRKQKNPNWKPFGGV